MFTYNYAIVVATNGIKKLFIGDVLKIEDSEDPNAIICWDLTGTKQFTVPSQCLAEANSQDIYNSFLSLSACWAFHVSNNTINYLTRITKIDLPYVYHESAPCVGSDMVYNFKAALDTEIFSYLVSELSAKGLMKGGSFISKSDKKTYFVQEFKLDTVSKKLILECIDDVSKTAVEKYADDIKKINSVLGKTKDLLSPGDVVAILLPNAPHELFLSIDKLDLNSFYSELTQSWYDFDELKHIRKCTLEEKNKFESFDYSAVINSLFSLLSKFHEKFPVRDVAFMLKWAAFEREYFEKYEQLIGVPEEKSEESSENPENS